jgi:fumarate reductase subunit D
LTGMSVPQNGPAPVKILVTAVVAGFGLLLARGSFNDRSLADIASAIGIAVVVSMVLFGGLYLLWNRWDRWRGR